MARRRRRKSGRKNPRRVSAARRAYRRSSLFKYNQRRKRHRGKKHRARRHRRHHARRHHRKSRKHYKRLSKAEAQAARISRKLARSKRVVVVPRAKLSSHQLAYVAKLRARHEASKALPSHHWAS